MDLSVLHVPKRTRPKLGVRQRCPDLPNLRDHGMTVDRELLRILRSCQRAHGYAFASEASLRAMFFQDTGHMPGVGTIPSALVRMELCGLLESRWIHRNSMLPDGNIAEVGTRRIRVAENRNERRHYAQAAHSGKINRRESVSGRPTYAVPPAFAGFMREMTRVAPTKPDGQAQQDAYADRLEWSRRELARMQREGFERGPPS